MRKDQSKTKQALIQELVSLRKRIAELEQSESERERVEEALRRVDRALLAIISVDEVLLRTADELGLMSRICQVIVEVAGYRLAWVGFAGQDETKPVHPVAMAGYEEGYLDTVNITWNNTERGHGPTGRAIRTGRPDIEKNILTDPRYAPWREEATRRGYASSIALPLKVNGRTLGALNIYAPEPDAFDEQEVELLVKLANNLAYGIAALRIRAARKQVEETLQESEERYRSLSDTSPDSIFVANQKTGEIISANAAACRLYGYTKDEFLRMKHSDISAEPEKTKVAVRDSVTHVPLRLHRKKDGTVFPVEISGSYFVRGGRKLHTAFIRDITDRMYAEEVLRESEERFRLLIHNSSDMIAIIDANGVERYVSKSVERVTGFTSQEIIAESGFKFLHPDDIPSIAGALQELLDHPEQQVRHEYRHRHKDGSWLHMEAIGANFLNDPRIRGIIMNIRDITERKQADEARRRAEEKYRDIFENTVEGIYRTTPAGRFVVLNPAFARICGYASPEEMTEKVTDIANQLYANPEDRLRFQKLIAAEGEVKGFHVQFKHPTKGLVWISINSKALRDEQGNICYYDGTIEDITDRKRVEEKLRVSEEMYRKLVETANEAIYIAQDDMLKFVNPMTVEITGYSQQELTSTPLSEFIHPGDRDVAVGRHLRRLKGEAVPDRNQCRIIVRDGSIKWAEISGVLIYWEGKPATLNLLTDITERKRAEGALRQAEENFRRSMDESPLGVRIVTEEGETIYANRAILDIYGYDGIEELRTTPLKERYTPESYVEFHIRREKRRRGDYQPPEYEISIVRKDGEVRHLRVFRKEVFWDGERQFQVLYNDITERKQVEEALQESERRYQQLVDNTDTGFVVIDDKGIVIMANEPYQWIAGAKAAEDIIGHSVIEWTAPDEKENNAKAVALCARQGFIKDFETVYQHGDGTRVHILINATMQESLEGGKHIVSFCHDITYRKRVEESLRVERNKLEAVTKNIGVGLAIISKDYRTIWANDVIRDMFGETEGKLCYVTYNQQQTICPWCGVKRVFEAGEDNVVTEAEGYDKDGNRICSQIIATPIRDESGEVTAALEVVVPITKRKQAEELLRYAEQRYRRLFEEAPVMYIITHNEGGVPMVADCNLSFLSTLGYAREEVVGQPLAGFYTPESRTELLEGGYKRALEGRFVAEERQLLTRNGHIAETLLRAVPEITADGSTIGTRAMYVDITDRKQAEKTLRESEGRLQLLSATADMLLRAEDPQTFVEDLCRDVMTQLDCQAFFNFLVDERAGRLRLHACAGIPEEEARAIEWLDYGVAVCGSVAQKGHRIITEDILHTPDVRTELVKSYGIQAYCCHPLMSQDRLIGTLSFGTKSRTHFTPDEVELMRIVSDQVAVVMRRTQAEEALKASHQQLRTFAGRLQSVREEQRKEFAREIHDELGGALTALKIDLSFLSSSAPKSWHKTKRDSLLSKILEMTKLIDETIGTVRRLVTELRPSILDDFGILAALEWQLQEFQKRTGIQCEFVSNVEYINMDEEFSIAVFRIFQEALTNVARHANATKVTATLYKEADNLVVKVEDNGKGISEGDIHSMKSIGLTGMRERALFLGGKINFSGEPSKGTTVSVQFPYKEISSQA